MRPALTTSLRRATLVLLLCAAGTLTVTGAQAAHAVPTCHGRPATIVGTSGDDDLRGTSGDDVIVGGKGIDSIQGGRGDDVLCGGPSPFRPEDRSEPGQLNGGPGDDILISGNDSDGLDGGTGADLLVGRGGSDYLSGGAGVDVLHGGPGADELDGGRGDDRIFGQAGADRIADREGANRVHGGDGADVFASGRGDETVDGGRGRDLADYGYVLGYQDGSVHCHPVTADLARGTASGVGFGTDTLTDVEGVHTGGGNDVLVGDSGPNTFYTGSPYHDSPQCDDPAPTESVSGGGGADRIRFDTNNLTSGVTSGPVRVDLTIQRARWRNDVIVAGAESAAPRPPVELTLDSIENVTGTALRDVIIGDDGPNSLSGADWSVGDVIKGRGGADHLYGHRGRDRFYGGAGPDVLYGGRNADRLRGGPGADRLFGSRGDDRLDGGAGHNRNAGGAGTDTCTRPRRGALAFSCER